MTEIERTDVAERGFPALAADTLPKLLRHRCQQWPRHVCERHKQLGFWREFTWADVYDQVRSFALGLASLGFGRGDTIAIVGENEPQLFWSELAALSLGAVAVCVSPEATPAEMQYIIANAEAACIIAQDQEQVDKALEIVDSLPLIRKIIYWDSQGMWGYRQQILGTFATTQDLGRRFGELHPRFFDEAVDAGKGTDLAVISYTSGTTGAPKGVLMSHHNILDSGLRYAAAVPIRPFSEYLSYLSPAWSAEQFFGIGLGLSIPLTVNFPESPETVQESIREIGAELLAFGPRQWEAFASLVQARMLDARRWRRIVVDQAVAIGQRVNVGRLEGRPAAVPWRLLYPLANLLVLRPIRDRLGLSKTYFAISGGAAMAPEVFRFFHAIGVKLRNAYGGTETGFITIHKGDRYDLNTVGTLLKPHPRTGPPLEWRVGAEGELLVRGGASFLGYHKNPGATAAVMLDGWIRTGDAFSVTERGELVYLERVSEMRRLSTGHSFPPSFVEVKLRFSPYVKDAIVLGDKEKSFVSALINIDAETCGRWAEKRGVAYSSFADLSQNVQIRRLIRDEIAVVNRLLPNESRVRLFANLPKELDPDEGEMTRSRKLRRDFVESRFKDIIDAIYRGDGEVTAAIAVKYRTGQVGTVRQRVLIVAVDAETALIPSHS